MNELNETKDRKHALLNEGIFRSLLINDFQILSNNTFRFRSNSRRLIYYFAVRDGRIRIMVYNQSSIVALKYFDFMETVLNYNPVFQAICAMYDEALLNLQALKTERANTVMHEVDFHLPSGHKWASHDLFSTQATLAEMHFSEVVSAINDYNGEYDAAWRLPTRDDYEELVHNVTFFSQYAGPYFLDVSSHQCMFFENNIINENGTFAPASHWVCSSLDNPQAVKIDASADFIDDVVSTIKFPSIIDSFSRYYVRLITD